MNIEPDKKWQPCLGLCRKRFICSIILTRPLTNLWMFLRYKRPKTWCKIIHSTIKTLSFSSISTILFPICSCPSFLLCIPKVVSRFLPGCSAATGFKAPSILAFKAPSISDHFFFISSSSFLVSSAACLVALTIGWKRVCNSSPIASFISCFIILRCLTVFIAVTYSLTRVSLSAGSLISRNDMLTAVHTQTTGVWGCTCICIEETDLS